MNITEGPSAQANAQVNAHAIPMGTIGRSRESLRQHAGHIVRAALARVATLFDRRAQVEAIVVDRYTGHSWNDSTERAMVDEIVSSRI